MLLSIGDADWLLFIIGWLNVFQTRIVVAQARCNINAIRKWFILSKPPSVWSYLLALRL
jgi:hypothetical protein